MSDTPHLDALRVVLANYPAGHRADYHADLGRMLTDLPAEPRGTAAQWFQQRDGVTVETLQVRRNGSPWLPGPRIVDARRPSYVSLDGSRRDYAGTRVIAAGTDVLVIHADPDGFDHVIVFRTVPRS